LHIVARNCALPFPWHTHKNCFTKNRTKISVLTLASWNSYYKSLRLLSNLLVKGKPSVLPDRAIRRQSHYFIYRTRITLYRTSGVLLCRYCVLYISFEMALLYIYIYIYIYVNVKRKDKSIPLQTWTDPEGSRSLRIPDFKTISTWRW